VEALPIIRHNGITGVRAVALAQLFGVRSAKKTTSRAMLRSENCVVVPGTIGRVLTSAAGAAELLLHLPKGAEIGKVKARCADVLASEAQAPKRSRTALGIARWVLDLAVQSNANLSVAVQSNADLTM
jgi:hypothetical protein